MKKYINYNFSYDTVTKILQTMNKKRLNIFIDLQSICTGFYNKNIILYEIGEYATTNKISNKLLIELKEYLNNLWYKFKQFDPYYILFYDNGYNTQGKVINNAYKEGRTNLETILDEDQQNVEIFRQIKRYYFETINVEFKKPNICSVAYLRNYESDLVPHYCITNNIFDSHDPDILNLILSTDKDLLQTCKFTNTIQCCTTFKNTKDGKRINMRVFDKLNAISYIYENFKPGKLTAEHIPLVLAIAGDGSDNIYGIQKGIGNAGAVKLIDHYNIPTKIYEIKNQINRMPEVIQNNLNKLIENLKLIDFDEQISRTPKQILTTI
jgi:hypothetical protein